MSGGPVASPPARTPRAPALARPVPPPAPGAGGSRPLFTTPEVPMPATTLPLAGAALLALVLLALALVPLWLIALGAPEDPVGAPVGGESPRPE